MRAIHLVASLTTLAATLVTAAGCGDSKSNPVDGGNGNNPDGFAITPGASVLTPSVTRMTVKSTGGGFAGQPVVGAACSMQLWMYTLDITTGELDSDFCSLNGPQTDPASYVPVVAKRTLSATELDEAKAALAAVHVSPGQRCGADKDQWTLELASATAGIVYGDDFYACTHSTYEHFVVSEDLSGLRSVMVTLAP